MQDHEQLILQSVLCSHKVSYKELASQLRGSKDLIRKKRRSFACQLGENLTNLSICSFRQFS